MATKRKKSAKPKKASAKNVGAASRAKTASKAARRKALAPSRAKTVSKPAAKQASAKKTKKTKTETKRKPMRRNPAPEPVNIDRKIAASRSGAMSGDLQGLRDTGRADSESVGELLEEGNAFEAGIVSGVEEAEDQEEGEVRTREVPEDDVPPEYLDND
jgi:hypothetical protein